MFLFLKRDGGRGKSGLPARVDGGQHLGDTASSEQSCLSKINSINMASMK
jgi:hypothetical protein